MQFVVVVPDRSLKLKWILSSSFPTPPLHRPVALTAVNDGSSFHVPIIRLQLSSISLSPSFINLHLYRFKRHIKPKNGTLFGSHSCISVY